MGIKDYAIVGLVLVVIGGYFWTAVGSDMRALIAENQRLELRVEGLQGMIPPTATPTEKPCAPQPTPTVG